MGEKAALSVAASTVWAVNSHSAQEGHSRPEEGGLEGPHDGAPLVAHTLHTQGRDHPDQRQ